MAGLAEVIEFRTYSAPSLETAPRPHIVRPPIEPPVPEIRAIPELDSDKFTRHKAAKFSGHVLAGHTMQSPEAPVLSQPIQSLHHAIQLGGQGNQEAIKLIDLSVGTEMIEQTNKIGVMDPVPLEVLPGSKVMQFDQLGDAIQENSLRLFGDDPLLGPRTKAETNNHFRTEDLNRADWFDDNSMLIISPAENDPERFFTVTMSVAMQLVSKDGVNLQLETAFVAGIAELGGDCRDIEIIIAFGELVGIDYRNMTKAQIIDTPIQIPNRMVKNGAIDVAKLWDAAATKVYGRPVFFGEFKIPQTSYEDYLATCRQRTTTFDAHKVAVRKQLIAEKDTIKTSAQAVERLIELSEARMVKKAIKDHSINPRVFGPQSAATIVQARAAESIGDMVTVARLTKLAIETAATVSCNGLRKRKLGAVEMGPEDLSAELAGNAEDEPESDADCEYVSEACPLCAAKKVKTTVKVFGKGSKRVRVVTGDCKCSKTYSAVKAA